jgi:hypothetical protein
MTFLHDEMTAPAWAEAMADSRGMIAVAQPMLTGVPDDVLLQAVTSMRPASAAQIAALS